MLQPEKSVWEVVTLEQAVALICEMDGAGIVVTDEDVFRKELAENGLKSDHQHNWKETRSYGSTVGYDARCSICGETGTFTPKGG